MTSARSSMVAAFARRDFAMARTYRFALALEAIELLLLVTLFFFLGRVVDGSELAGRAGVTGSYFAFVGVALALTQIMRIGLSSFAMKLRRDQTAGTLEALLVTPAPISLIVLGSAVYDVTRALVMSVLMVVVAVAVFGLELSVDATSAGILLIALVATLVLFLGMGVAIAAATLIFKETSALLGLLITALTLLSGVYYPLDVLPGALRLMAEASPFTWVVDVFRAACLGGEIPWTSFGLLIASSALSAPLGMTLFTRALAHAKRTGTLAQY